MNKEKLECEGRLPMVIDMTDAVTPLMEALDVDESDESNTVDKNRDEDDNLEENNME